MLQDVSLHVRANFRGTGRPEQGGKKERKKRMIYRPKQSSVIGGHDGAFPCQKMDFA